MRSKKRSSHGLPSRNACGLAPSVFHTWHGAADELVAARPFHAVDAQVGAADADDVLRRPGARRVVLGGDEPVARIDRRRHRRAEIDVAEAHHQVVGVEDDVAGRRRAESSPLIRRMNSMLSGHQGASSRTEAMYCSMVSWIAGSFHDSGRWTMRLREGEVVERREPLLGVDQRLDQPCLRQHAAVVVQLERADARRDVDDAGQRHRRDLEHQRVDAQAQVEIEHDRAVLDEQVLVALRGGCGPRARPCAGAFAQHGSPATSSGSSGCASGCLPAISACLRGHSGLGRDVADGNEADSVARRELAELPPVGGDDRQRADEPTEARPVGPEDDRHVAGEVDRADGVGVSWMFDGCSPASPPSSRAHSTGGRSGARRCGRSCSGPSSRSRRTASMPAGDEVGRAVRTVDDRELPLGGERRPSAGSTGPASTSSSAACSGPRWSTSPVRSSRPPCPPNPPRVNVDAEPSTVAVDAAADEQVGAQPATGAGAEREGAALGHDDRRPRRYLRAVTGDVRLGAGDADRRRRGEPQRRPGRGALEARRTLRVADDRLPSRNDRSSIGPLGGTPTCHKPIAPGEVLHGRRARREDVDGAAPYRWRSRVAVVTARRRTRRPRRTDASRSRLVSMPCTVVCDSASCNAVDGFSARRRAHRRSWRAAGRRTG